MAVKIEKTKMKEYKVNKDHLSTIRMDKLEERKASRKVTAITNAKEIPEFDLLMQCSKHQLADKLTHFLCVIRALRENQNKDE